MSDHYRAFLLRLWRVGQGEGAVWRTSLEDPHSGEVRAFASLEALMAFLEGLIEGQGSAESTGEPVAGPWRNKGGGPLSQNGVSPKR